LHYIIAAAAGGKKSGLDNKAKLKLGPHHRRDDVKISHSYALKTERHEFAQLTIPVLSSTQDHLVGHTEDDFSDVEECDDEGEPVWSRFCCKMQLEVALFDVACGTKEPQFNDVIAVGGSTIYHPDINAAAEVTLFVHKNMGTGSSGRIWSEINTNPYDAATYQDKFSKHLKISM